jgi:hypothetical protein
MVEEEPRFGPEEADNTEAIESCLAVVADAVETVAGNDGFQRSRKIRSIYSVLLVLQGAIEENEVDELADSCARFAVESMKRRGEISG